MVGATMIIFVRFGPVKLLIGTLYRCARFIITKSVKKYHVLKQFIKILAIIVSTRDISEYFTIFHEKLNFLKFFYRN